MKIRSLIAIVGLAISFTLPTFAQQTTAPDPQLRDAFVALNKKLDDALLNSDAATMTGFYTEDACLVEPNKARQHARAVFPSHDGCGWQ